MLAASASFAAADVVSFGDGTVLALPRGVWERLKSNAASKIASARVSTFFFSARASTVRLLTEV